MPTCGACRSPCCDCGAQSCLRAQIVLPSHLKLSEIESRLEFLQAQEDAIISRYTDRPPGAAAEDYAEADLGPAALAAAGSSRSGSPSPAGVPAHPRSTCQPGWFVRAQCADQGVSGGVQAATRRTQLRRRDRGRAPSTMRSRARSSARGWPSRPTTTRTRRSGRCLKRGGRRLRTARGSGRPAGLWSR